MSPTLEVERAVALRERRATIRVGCFLPAQYQPASAAGRVTGRIINICVQGVGMLGSAEVRVGEEVAVLFFLPGEDHLLSVAGVVCWTEDLPETQEYRFGIAYTRLDDTTRFCLEAFIQGHLHPPRALRGVKRQLHQLRHDLSPEVLQVAQLFVLGVAILGLCAWVISTLR